MPAFNTAQTTWLARLVRKMTIAGRAARGYFSVGGYATAPTDPQQAPFVQRAQHYGFTSEPPDGAECISLAINGGASNRVSVAELVVGEPEIESGEVVLYATFGQRILLNKDGDVVITPKSGRHILLGGADASDPVVTKSTFDNFVSTFNGHQHLAGTLVAGMTSVTGTTATPTATNGNAPDRVAQTK